MMYSFVAKTLARVLVRPSAAITIRGLLVFIFFSASAFSQAAFAQSYTFSKLEVIGNKRIASSTILSYAGLALNQTTNAGDLNAAYRNIIASNLFEQVDLQPIDEVLQIAVVELPTLNKIVFEGNVRLKTEVLQKLIGSQPRRVFNPELAERDAAQIALAYVQAGRLAAKVTPKAIRRSDNRVDLIFEIFEGGLVEIERLSFVGNNAFSDRRLRGVLATKQAGIFRDLVGKDTFISDRIEYDKQLLKDFYASRGYIDFQIADVSSELSREHDGMFVTFIVKEGQKFTFEEVTVVSDIVDLDLETFRKAIKTKKDAVYSPLQVETDITRMERLALLKDYNFLRVEPRINRNDRLLSLNVEYRLSYGPRVFVERINITGNTTTVDSVIRRQFRIVEGDPFNPRALRQSAERIKALGFFSNSSVEPREGSSNTQAIIEVVVEEQPTGTLSFGGAYSSTVGFAAEISYKERNFLGRGQTVGVTLSNASTNKKYEFSFQDPGFLNRDLVAGIDLSYAGTDIDDSAFNTNELSFAPYVAFPMGENSNLRLGYSLAKTQIAKDSAATNNVGETIQAEILKGDVVNSLIGYRYGYDSRRSGLNPNAGF
ncbi:MAG: outer membrane protein assembly factor BamA, partial [Paracoccaceae bacterium]|nr:outer membrane protein assembly factor BamA [Paracoccaceae bacterium]